MEHSGADSGSCSISITPHPKLVNLETATCKQRHDGILNPHCASRTLNIVILAISLLIGFGVSAFAMAVALFIFSVASDLDR